MVSKESPWTRHILQNSLKEIPKCLSFRSRDMNYLEAGVERLALSTSLKKRSDNVVNLHKTLLSVILVLTLIVCDFQTLNTLEMLCSGRTDGSRCAHRTRETRHGDEMPSLSRRRSKALSSRRQRQRQRRTKAQSVSHPFGYICINKSKSNGGRFPLLHRFSSSIHVGWSRMRIFFTRCLLSNKRSTFFALWRTGTKKLPSFTWQRQGIRCRYKPSTNVNGKNTKSSQMENLCDEKS